MNEFNISSESTKSTSSTTSRRVEKGSLIYLASEVDGVKKFQCFDKVSLEMISEMLTSSQENNYLMVHKFGGSLWLIHHLQTVKGEETNYLYYLQNFPYLINSELGQVSVDVGTINRGWEVLRLDKDPDSGKIYYGQHGGAQEINEEIINLFLHRGRITGVKEEEIIKHLQNVQLKKRTIEEEFETVFTTNS